MDSANDVEEIISTPRFSTYVNEVSGDRDRAVQLYHWTGEVAGAFLPDYRHLEVAYRNRIDTALQTHVDALSGWSPGTAWFDDQSWVRHHRWNDAAKRELRQAKWRAGSRGRTVSRGAVIAELTFGFWRYIASPRYKQSFWNPILDNAFTAIPGATPEDRRNELENALIPLNKLRNRIAHHEPIFRPFQRRVSGGQLQSYSLNQQHDLLLQVLHWIDNDLGDWVATNSEVPNLLTDRP